MGPMARGGCDLVGWNGRVDNINHILRLCPTAMTIWSSTIRHDHLNEFVTMNFNTWVVMNLLNSQGFVRDLHDWDLLFGAIV
ncbi:hypothetical protein GQ457_10G022180 [Hibiscus cannabinus]